MAVLELPETGPIYAAAAIFIYAIEGHPVYSELLRPLWERSTVVGQGVVTSELTLLEVLIRPLRLGDMALADDFRAALGGGLAVGLPIDARVLELAAHLRARHQALRSPDAVHLAPAELAGCGAFVTNDKRLRGAARMPIQVLGEAVSR